MEIGEVVQELLTELARAEKKHPKFPIDPVHASSVLNEEAGELVKAALEYTYEGADFDEMRKEAIQTGAMAIRFLLNMPSMVKSPSKQVNRNEI